MEIWGAGINTYYKNASIYIDIVSRPLYCIERIVEYFCCIRLLRWIKFPSFLHITDKDDGSVYTLKEWWGDLAGWFHCVIHTPVFNCLYNTKRYKSYSFEIDYEKYKEYLKETNPKMWKKIEKEEKEYDEEKKCDIISSQD